MKVWRYVRKPFFVNAVQVTIENLEDVAKWCDGVIREASPRSGQPRQKYVKVRVMRPLNEKQTMAFPGDFVLQAGVGFKIYTAKAFFNTFDPSEDDYDYGTFIDPEPTTLQHRPGVPMHVFPNLNKAHLVEIDEAHRLPEMCNLPGCTTISHYKHPDSMIVTEL
jgi:hypothetical protein